jgi:hypothetical protein
MREPKFTEPERTAILLAISCVEAGKVAEALDTLRQALKVRDSHGATANDRHELQRARIVIKKAVFQLEVAYPNFGLNTLRQAATMLGLDVR